METTPFSLVLCSVIKFAHTSSIYACILYLPYFSHSILSQKDSRPKSLYLLHRSSPLDLSNVKVNVKVDAKASLLVLQIGSSDSHTNW